MISRKFLYLFFILFSGYFLFSETASEDKVIQKLEIVGLKKAYNRVMKEIPVYEGGIWNSSERKKTVDFFKKCQSENVFEDGDINIEETPKENKSVDIKIFVTEKMRWFMFITPKWSNNSGLTLKYKFWSFYFDGYKLPIEAELEYLQQETLNLAIRSSELINITDRLSTQFEVKAYTSSLNYAISQNSSWVNGIENIYAKLNYTIPGIEMTVSPELGFGYGNTITTPGVGILMMTPYTSISHAVLFAPKFGISYPIHETSGTISTNLGFGYKNQYFENDSFQKSSIQELSISLMPNNPKSIPDPLSYPISVSFTNPIPYINATFNTSLGFAYKTSVLDYKNYLTISKLYPNKCNMRFFENTILPSLSKADSDFIKSKYTRDGNNEVYNLNSDVTDTDKLVISDILNNFFFIDDSYTYYSGMYINPSLNFALPVKNTGLSFTPGFQMKYYFKWQPDVLTYNVNFNRNQTDIIPSLAMTYAIPFIDATLSINIELWYTKIWYYVDGSNLSYNKLSLKNTFISFEKNFYFDQDFLDSMKTPDTLKQKAEQSFKIVSRFKFDPIYIDNTILNSSNSQSPLSGTNIENLVMSIEGYYNLYLPAYKYNKFKFRLMAFASNASFIKNNNETDSITGNWIRGNGYEFFGGWFGMVANMEFWLNLFTFDTPKIAGFSLSKPFSFQMYWIIYADVGFSFCKNEFVGSNGINYTVDINGLHLLPVLTVGTGINVFPKFVPLALTLDVNVSIYNMLKSKSLAFSFSFSFSKYIEDSWFKR